MSGVTPFKPKIKTDEEGLAVGIAFRMQLDEGAEMTFQTALDQDTPPEVANSVLDRWFAIAERQRARAQIPEWEVKRTMAAEALGIKEREFAEREIALKTQIEKNEADQKEAAGEIERLSKEGYDEHVASGRRSAYTPQGHRKSEIDRSTAQVNKLMAERAKLEAEFQQYAQTARPAMERDRKALEQADERLREFRAKVGA